MRYGMASIQPLRPCRCLTQGGLEVALRNILDDLPDAVKHLEGGEVADGVAVAQCFRQEVGRAIIFAGGRGGVQVVVGEAAVGQFGEGGGVIPQGEILGGGEVADDGVVAGDLLRHFGAVGDGAEDGDDAHLDGGVDDGLQIGAVLVQRAITDVVGAEHDEGDGGAQQAIFADEGRLGGRAAVGWGEGAGEGCPRCPTDSGGDGTVGEGVALAGKGVDDWLEVEVVAELVVLVTDGIEEVVRDGDAVADAGEDIGMVAEGASDHEDSFDAVGDFFGKRRERIFHEWGARQQDEGDAREDEGEGEGF